MFLINPYIYGVPVDYLVDDYSPVVAYSTQKISSTAPYVVRVRRGSDSAKSDFSALELTNGTATTWTGANDGRVTKWYNQGTGGSTYDLIQTVAGNQPSIISAGSVIMISGIPTIKYLSSGSRYLTCANTPFGQVSNSFLTVSSARVTNTAGIILSLSNTASNSVRIIQDSRTTPNRNLAIRNTTPTDYFADLSTARTAADTLILLSSFVDASKGMSTFDNGATGGTATFTGTWTNDAIQVGRLSGATPAYLDGNVSELIGFSTDEIASRSAIETNINDRFAIY